MAEVRTRTEFLPGETGSETEEENGGQNEVESVEVAEEGEEVQKKKKVVIAVTEQEQQKMEERAVDGLSGWGSVVSVAG